MYIQRILVILSATLAIAFAGTAMAAKPADKAPAKEAADPAADSNGVPYDDLYKYIGDKIVVNTKFQTTRIGVLTRYSKTELTLSIDTAGGPTELTIPKSTVAKVTLAASSNDKK